MTDHSRRFPFRYGIFRWLLTALGTGPRFSSVRVDQETVQVRMGWAFSATIPRSRITAVRRGPNTYWGIGVHGWAGQWLVNGSVTGIVRIELAAGVRARVIGVPVRLRLLAISLEDPDGFVEVLG